MRISILSPLSEVKALARLTTYDPVVLVRPAGPNDVLPAARVHHEASEAAYVGIPNASTLVGRITVWEDALANHERWPFVVEVDDEIVGVLIIGPASRNAATGELYVIYVRPSSWGTGAAQRLIECAHEQLKQRFQAAVLSVLASNARARRFYERNGWVLSDVKVEPHFGGRPTEIAIYHKSFGPQKTDAG